MFFESLENRQFFSAGVFTPLNIYGTGAADTITLSQTGHVLTVVQNGVSNDYSTYYLVGTSPNSGTAYGISKVVIYGYGGNDSIKADASVQLNLEIYGGAGNDTMYGGA